MSASTGPSYQYSPAIPALRIVETDAVLPHEEHDAQRAEPLIQRIRDAGVLLNPPIVAPIHENAAENSQRYVIMDGANRHYCIRALGIPHILVQVVEYGSREVTLDTWNHVLSHVEVDDLLARVYGIEGFRIEETDLESAHTALENGDALVYIRILMDQILMFTALKNDFETRTRKLRELVNTYKTIAKMDRLNSNNLNVVRQLYPNAQAVVVFPQYSSDEIIRAAREKIYLPPGISRHIIQGRAMRLHYPLTELRNTDKTTADKNNDLTRWLHEQVAQRRLRLYAESTYIFDE